MIRVSLRLFFILLLALLSVNLYARTVAVCPSAKDIMASNVPAGQFAKTIWNLDRARFDQSVLHNSVLIFSKETIEAGFIHLTGYFWWRRGSAIRECSKVEGTFTIATREIELQTISSTSHDIVEKSIFTATLSTDGTTLMGKMHVRSPTKISSDVGNRIFSRVLPALDVERMRTLNGTWQATKIYPVPVDG